MMKHYYARVLLDNGERKTGELKATREEAQKDLIELMKKYNAHGGDVQYYN